MKKIIGYVRVSTEDQGVAGNGLEAQRAEILKFVEDNGYELLGIEQEVASGKLDLDCRPVLKDALKRSSKSGAIVVVSKLDRFSRSAQFILNMMASKAKFVVTQFGEGCDEFMLHMYAVLGEKERTMIGVRTKDALKVLRAKGVKLGNPNKVDKVKEDGSVSLSLASAGAIGAKSNAAKANEFASLLKPLLQRAMDAGMSATAVAKEFNATGVKTARGGQWSAATILNIIARWNTQSA